MRRASTPPATQSPDSIIRRNAPQLDISRILVSTPQLSCYDLTRPIPSSGFNCPSQHSTLYPFVGHTDVKELAMYVQDTITKRNWAFNLGIRGDFYNGLAVSRQAEPRVGISYNIQKTNTVLRASYARTLETPFNENLVLSRNGCYYPVIAALVPCVPAPLRPGFRNEFHAGLQQAFGRFLVIDGEYIWKYTHNAYDFSVLGNTPITFPIEWHNSKIPGWALRASVPVLSRLQRAGSDVERGRPLLPAAGRRLGSDGRDRAAFRSASITTRSSTRPHTCNTRRRGNAGRGSASTGGMTADWWQAQCLATDWSSTTARSRRRSTVNLPVDPQRPDRGPGVSGGTVLQCVRATPVCAVAFALPGITVWIEPGAGTGARERRTTTTIRLASRRATCLTWRSGDDNLFKGDRTSGACS